jgi:Tol biopolymer transport system component
MDGVEGKVYNSGPIPAIQFSPDGKRTMYLYGSLIVDGVEIAKQADQALFSPNSRRVAYVKGIDWNKTYVGAAKVVVLDGNEQGPYFLLFSKPIFSPDSQRIAYIASASMDVSDRKRVVVLDGQPGKPYNEINDLTFSPDSQHLAYKVFAEPQDGRSFVVSYGTEGPLYSNVANPVFSRDGRLAYVVNKANINKSFVVVNGEEGKYYDWVSRPTFSPDGRHLVYFARDRNDYFAVVDGIEMKRYERIIGHETYPSLSSSDDKSVIEFDTSSSFHYLAQSGENIYMVKETIK